MLGPVQETKGASNGQVTDRLRVAKPTKKDRERRVAHTLERLGSLQLEVLATLVPEMGDFEGDAYFDYLPKVVALAREHGFEPLGGGSSRIGVALEDFDGRGPAVAKIAYTPEGLLLNLQEAVFWLAGHVERLPRYLAPCYLLAPTLVLVQERVELCGPPLTDHLGASKKRQRELDRQRSSELKRRADEIFELRTALYLVDFEREMEVEIRLDNFGVRRNGDVVSIDYGQKWEPLEVCWELVLRRLEDGPLPCTGEEAGWLVDETCDFSEDSSRTQRLRWVESLDLMAFLNRAGLEPDDSDPCPCGSGASHGECYPEKCNMAIGALAFMRYEALFPGLPPPFFEAAHKLGSRTRRKS